MKQPLHVTIRGFSLIELLVSLSIFTIVVTMAVGTLLVLIDANGKAQNIQSSLTNIIFSLDSMTREIRTGTRYFCDTRTSVSNSDGTESFSSTQDCASNFNANYLSIIEGGSSLTAGGDPRISYYYDDAFDHGGGNVKGALLRRIGAGDWAPLTGRQVDIQTFGLNVDGSTPASAGDRLQPSVIVIIEGQAGEIAAVDTSFTLQAYVAQRQLDI